MIIDPLYRWQAAAELSQALLNPFSYLTAHPLEMQSRDKIDQFEQQTPKSNNICVGLIPRYYLVIKHR